jgi:hypothetical protein
MSHMHDRVLWKSAITPELTRRTHGTYDGGGEEKGKGSVHDRAFVCTRNAGYRLWFLALTSVIRRGDTRCFRATNFRTT